jgi:hypothetical protein
MLPEIARFTMRTKKLSFQLEETVPGTFFFQGIAGGMLAGLLLIVGHALWATYPNRDWVIPLTPVYMVMLSIIGIVQDFWNGRSATLSKEEK